MAGLQSDEGRMSDSVIRAQYINVADSHIDSKCHASAWRRAAKTSSTDK